MKNTFFALALTLAALLGVSQTVKADIDTLTPEDGWTRLTEMPADDWDSYYYVIADYANPLVMQLGIGENQDAKYNAMWYQSPKDPFVDQTILWTMEKNIKSDGSKTYALARNVAYDKYFLQTESDKAYLFRTHDNGGGDKVWGRLEITPVAKDGEFQWFTIENGRYPASGSTTYKGYLGPWNDVSGDKVQAGYEVAANKLNTYVGHFIIYAIKKDKYQSTTEARFQNASTANPQDVTFLIKDQSMELAPAAVWKGLGTVAGSTKNRNGECGVGKTFDVSQTITGIPNGVYQLKAQGFYRAGSRSTAGAAHVDGTEVINAKLYANKEEVALMSVHEYMKTSSTGGFNSATTAGSKSVYIPNSQSSASTCFSDGFYDNVIERVVVTNGELTIGVRCDAIIDGDWACYDNFRLYFLGGGLDDLRQAALNQLESYEQELLVNPVPELESILTEAKTQINNAEDNEAITEALNRVVEAFKYHASAEEPTDTAIDLTSLIENADLKQGTKSWTADITNNSGYSQVWSNYSPGAPIAPSVLEAYAGYSALESTGYSLTQQVPLSPGTYRLRGYAFYRNSQDPNVSLAQMVASDNSVDIATLHSVTNIADIVPYAVPNNMHEASEAFAVGNYLNELIFTVDEASVVTIGYQGKHDVKQGWFIAGPITLEKINNNVLQAEAAKELALAKERFAERKYKYESIAAQYTADGITYDVTSATTMANEATTVKEVDSAIELLGKNLVVYMDQFDEDDVFDLTTLILNAGFETGNTEGWIYAAEEAVETGIQSTTGHCAATNMEGYFLFNTWITSSTTAYDHYLLQRIDNMPAGEFTLSAVVAGSQSNAAMRLLANSETTDYIACTDEKVGVPVRLTFNNDKPGAVRIGIKSNYWFKADNFTLYYRPFHADDWMAMDLGTVNLENDDVQTYLKKARYVITSATSVVANYVNGVSDRPRGVKIHIPHQEQEPSTLTLFVSDVPTYDGTDTNTREIALSTSTSLYNLYNTTPGYTYYYKVEADGTIITQGTFTTAGTVRMIYTEKGSNIRDLGGRKTTDNKIVRYGRLYRGGEMHAGGQTSLSEADLKEMARLGIAAEVDLRCKDQTFNTIPTQSAIAGADYIYLDQSRFGSDAFESEDDRLRYKNAFTFIAKHMRAGHNVYFHCIWGADRTGALAMLLEGVLNFKLDDICKDYELTSFSKAGMREKTGLDSKITYLNQHNKGSNIQERMVDFLVNTCGVSPDDIQAIRDYMLMDDPTGIEDITPAEHITRTTDNNIYDLSGRRMGNNQQSLKPGLYIRNGKKFLK